MKLNDRSCLLDSFAYIMKLPVSDLALWVGHNGPEGYHSQELIEVALFKGWTVTAIERFPVAENPETHELRMIEFWGGTEFRFVKHLREREGVLLGHIPISMKSHAVAWAADHIYDSGADSYYKLITEDGLLSDHLFVPHVFLRMDKQ